MHFIIVMYIIYQLYRFGAWHFITRQLITCIITQSHNHIKHASPRKLLLLATAVLFYKKTIWSFFYFIAVNLVCRLCLFLLRVSACAAFWRNKDWLIDWLIRPTSPSSSSSSSSCLLSLVPCIALEQFVARLVVTFHCFNRIQDAIVRCSRFTLHEAVNCSWNEANSKFDVYWITMKEQKWTLNASSAN